eukprot:TRINITY_DN2036_c0_g3_i1.p1 TRINITY_DN2036_c0_g3~~TRINITY_DN2036_c0_g3_i1.p1  ORF type:complete len:1016 (+),score=234.59 TRINITY_DN2036_c0_g3_i1:148-3195(+)
MSQPDVARFLVYSPLARSPNPKIRKRNAIFYVPSPVSFEVLLAELKDHHQVVPSSEDPLLFYDVDFQDWYPVETISDLESFLSFHNNSAKVCLESVLIAEAQSRKRIPAARPLPNPRSPRSTNDIISPRSPRSPESPRHALSPITSQPASAPHQQQSAHPQQQQQQPQQHQQSYVQRIPVHSAPDPLSPRHDAPAHHGGGSRDDDEQAHRNITPIHVARKTPKQLYRLSGAPLNYVHNTVSSIESSNICDETGTAGARQSSLLAAGDVDCLLEALKVISASDEDADDASQTNALVVDAQEKIRKAMDILSVEAEHTAQQTDQPVATAIATAGTDSDTATPTDEQNGEEDDGAPDSREHSASAPSLPTTGEKKGSFIAAQTGAQTPIVPSSQARRRKTSLIGNSRSQLPLHRPQHKPPPPPIDEGDAPTQQQQQDIISPRPRPVPPARKPSQDHKALPPPPVPSTPPNDLYWQNNVAHVVLCQTIVRRWMARSRFFRIAEEFKKTPEGKRASRRSNIEKEILKTELHYVNALRDLKKNYIDPLNAADDRIASKKDINMVFSSILSILSCNEQLLVDLQKAHAQYKTGTSIGEVFKKFAPYLNMYTAFTNNFEASRECLLSMQKRQNFAAFVTRLERESRSTQTLESYLILPVQRIPRYVMLLKDLLKYTDEIHTEFQPLQEAYEQIAKVATHLNETKRNSENASKVVTLQEVIVTRDGKPSKLVEPGRLWVRDGVLYQKSDFKIVKYYAFLFNDFLIFTFPSLPIGFNGPEIFANASSSSSNSSSSGSLSKSDRLSAMSDRLSAMSSKGDRGSSDSLRKFGSFHKSPHVYYSQGAIALKYATIDIGPSHPADDDLLPYGGFVFSITQPPPSSTILEFVVPSEADRDQWVNLLRTQVQSMEHTQSSELALARGDETQNIAKDGILSKKGSYMRFKAMYVALRGATLFLYSRKGELSPSENPIPLLGYTIRKESTTSFTLCHPVLASHTFQAADEDNFAEWVMIIDNRIKLFDHYNYH